jgi:PEP-CTERM motif
MHPQPQHATRWRSLAAGLALGLALGPFASTASAASFTFSFDNLYSVDELGADGNVRLTHDLGAGAYITAFQWDVVVSAFDPSFLSELTLDFTASSGVGVSFSPAGEAYESGELASSGSVNLVNAGQAFTLGNDGLLHLEFHEFYDDDTGLPDGAWNTGTLTFQYVSAVPEPGTLALWAGGVLGLAAVRRRRLAPARPRP